MLPLACIIAILFFVLICVQQIAARQERTRAARRFLRKTSRMGMNERLLHAQLLADFEAAARAGNTEVMTAILQQVEFDDVRARLIAEAITSDPAAHGY